MAVLVTGILSVCLIVAVLIAWGMRYTNEDLFTALCAGRDVFTGRLGQPDQWSFATNGKIWVNQSWLSGVVYYGSFLALHENGPFLLKGVLLFLCMIILFFRCPRLAASTDATILAMTFGVLGSAPFMGIRPENFGLLMLVVLTTFLTAPRTWGYSRPVGSLAAIWIWSNLHGSFMLGFGLIGLKAAIQFGRLVTGSSLVECRHDVDCLPGMRTEVIAWACTLLAAGFVSALGSPFGLSNLVMPFQQVGQADWVLQNKDWQPLLHWESLTTRDFLTPVDVLPFLFVLVAVLITALAAAFNRPITAGVYNKVRGDLLMEIFSSALIVALAFRFRRLTLFAAISLIPLLAFLIQSFSEILVSRRTFHYSKILRVFRGYGRAVLACCLLIFLTWVFCSKTVLPHLPGNPTLPDMPVAMQHMHWNSIYSNLVAFLKRNGISGRIFTSWPLAEFLFFHDPNIKMFVSGRAQTIYSTENLRDYLAICRATSKDNAASERSLDLLDKLGVKAAILPRTAEFGPLTDVLWRSPRWIGVYVDTRAFVFIRNDPGTVKRIAETAGGQGLWYPDRRTELLGDALLSMSRTRQIPPELEADMKSMAREAPEDAIYWIVAHANRNDSGCIEANVKDFLLSELNRLSKANFMVADGGNLVLKSLVEISVLLADDDKRSCPSKTFGINFERMANHWAGLYNGIANEFR